MAGSSQTSWSFSSRFAVPAALVVAEATWVSLLVDAAVNASSGPHVYLPFLVFVIPALLGTALGALGAHRNRGRWGWRAVITAPLVVAGVALSAGVISQLTRAGSLWQVTTEPWTAGGHAAAVTAGVAWFVATLAWGRGTWLGVAQPSFRHATWSVAVAGVAFLSVFAGRADGHDRAFRAATGPAGWLLFVGFPFAATALALVRQRDLEEQVLARAGSPPGKVWFTVLAVPMTAVALVALLLAVTVGPAAPVVGRAAARAAGAVWGAVTALWRLLPRGHAQPKPIPGRPGHPSPGVPPAHPLHVSLGVPFVVLDIFVGLVVLALVVLVLRYLRPRRLSGRKPTDAPEDQERDSVFSWRHLGTQLRRALAALRARLRFRRRAAGPRAAPERQVSLSDAPTTESVRRAYRRVLVAARGSGHGRAPTETPRELARRLSEGPAADAAGALGELTTLYDAVRYGEEHTDEPARQGAVARADTVSLVLEQPPPGGEALGRD